MTTSGSASPLVVVDTNVLLAATDRSRQAHRAATVFLNEDQRRLALTPQVVREYLAVSTRPVEANGLGLSGADAVANVNELLRDIALLPENLATTERLIELVAAHKATGRLVHDANVVAVALAHRAHAIVTLDARHFTRFSDAIGVEGLPRAR